MFWNWFALVCTLLDSCSPSSAYRDKFGSSVGVGSTGTIIVNNIDATSNQSEAKEDAILDDLLTSQMAVINQSNPPGLNNLKKKHAIQRKFEVLVKSVQGCKSFEGCSDGNQNEWENQDRGLALHEEGFTLLAVFDGHGTDGKLVSEALRLELNALFHAAMKKENWFQRLKRSMAGGKKKWLQTKIKVALTKVDREYQSGGGSTAVIAVVFSDQVLVANVGDSRAILLTAASPTAKPLSIDQTPCFEGTKRAEDERIQALSQCKYYRGEEEVQPSCERTSKGDIIRMYRSRSCGARFTRSIGDPECGDCAIPNPVFSVHKLTPSDEYLLLASDGLTEFLENEDIDRLARPHKGNLEGIVDSLLTESRNKWMENEDGEYVDDTTIALAKLG